MLNVPNPKASQNKQSLIRILFDLIFFLAMNIQSQILLSDGHDRWRPPYNLKGKSWPGVVLSPLAGAGVALPDGVENEMT